MRPRRMLRRLAQPARHRAPSRRRAPTDPIARARRRLDLVLRRRGGDGDTADPRQHPDPALADADRLTTVKTLFGLNPAARGNAAAVPLYRCDDCGFLTTASQENAARAHETGSPDCAGQIALIADFTR